MRLNHNTFMRMHVMFIMAMGMFVLKLIVSMIVLMPFRQMQPKADTHEDTGNDKLQRQRLAQQHNGDQCSNERSKRKIGPGARCAQMTIKL